MTTSRTPSWRRTRRSAVLVVSAAAVIALGGCGGDDAAARGESIARDVGCLGCHSVGTDDRLGPGWGGIWGEERQLADGSTAVVDDDYLRRAVTAPDSQVVAGWDPIMPTVALSDAELDDVLAYVREVAGG